MKHPDTKRRARRKPRVSLFHCLLGSWILAWGVSAAAPAAAPAPTDDPASELASFKLAPGFEANLFASESDGIVKPIQSRFDARGRLWVIGSTVYPQLEPGQVPNDKVVIVEDTDGDGRADKSTVFADGLFIPTGLELDDGGCYVGNSTELIHLRDSDGDGKADERRVVLRGFGTGDNHQNINSFQWSPGGELWFSQGLHSHSRVETPWGVEKLDQAGLWRLRPRQLRLDPFFGSEMAPHNPWGFVFDEGNRMFVLAGNGHGIFDPLPVLIRGHRITPLDSIWKDSRGRKVCGGDIVGNTHFPPEWQGVMLAGGFMNNAVYALQITEDGSSFSVADRAPLLTSTHTSFRPVDVKIGPDGAVYVTDWFNPIIGHYQASFRHPDRDKLHGRVWRITAKGRPVVKQPKLEGAPLPELFEHLKSADRFTRLHAKRLLADMDTDAVTNALARWLTTLEEKDPRVEHHRMEALGVYETHEIVAPALVSRLLRANDPAVRAYAAGVVARWQDRLPAPLALLKPLLADSHARVRLAAVVAAAAIASPDAMSVALVAVDKPMDKFLDYALRQAVFVRKPQWLPAFSGGRLGIEQNPAQLEFLVKADGSADTLQVVRNLLAKREQTPDAREAFLITLAEAGDATDLRTLLDPAVFTRDGVHDGSMHMRVLGALEQAARVRKLKPANKGDEALATLWSASGGNNEFHTALLRLATLWKSGGMKDMAMLAAFSTNATRSLRTAGAEALAALEGTNALPALETLAGPSRAPDERVAGTTGIAMLDLRRASEIAADILARDTTGMAAADVLPVFLARKGGAAPLADALARRAPSRDAARSALRVMGSTGREDKGLITIFNAAAGFSSEPLKATPQFVSQLAAEVREGGDARRGGEVFRRADLNCLACHSIGGEGGTIGPDLNSIGSGQPVDFIIGAVLEPNREVKENYESIEVTMKDGEMYTGYRVRSDGTEFALRDVARNQVVRLRRDQIVSQTNRGSVMPSGLADHLTRTELRDLIRFLSELGKAK